jgi:hypothetical protein
MLLIDAAMLSIGVPPTEFGLVHQASATLGSGPVAVAADGDHVAVVQQPV